MLKKRFRYGLLCLVSLLVVGSIAHAQDQLDLDYTGTEELAKEQKLFWQVLAQDMGLVGEVSVARTSASVEEVIAAIPMDDEHLATSFIGDTIENTIAWFGDELSEVLGEEWLKMAEHRATQLKGVSQTTFIGKDARMQINVASPYLSPITLEIYEGTYVVFTELLSQEVDNGDTLGEEATLGSVPYAEYLQGEWMLQDLPEIAVRIDNLVGGVAEEEITATRYLFRGEIRIDDAVYAAFTELDPINMYEYPICLISVLEEPDSVTLHIWFEDYERELSLDISSDFNKARQNGLAVQTYYVTPQKYHETKEGDADLSIRVK